MGTYRQTVVDLEASGDEAAALGERGRAWLVAEGVIRPVPWRGDVVHLAGPRWREAVELVSWDWRARIKDLEEEPGGEVGVVARPAVFHSDLSEAPAAICPHCRSADPAVPREAFDTWHATGAADLDCPACARRSPLPHWDWTDDSLAFAHLGFEFDDWPPLLPEFTAALGRELGHRIRQFACKI
ncbi:hypothetical protein ACFWG6_24935 [Streptomyces erythrochromogenes]|uniref:hypothetical protein n=1 Tax=Streptomyces erythrochromogenes TaxID=285574 RepID=UPI0004CD5C5A|nr:hypothetical protein [Streptomyces erythrochromogenes]MCX5582584.1 hypothetical protein [Streptomyces erythrochromogenes]